jgi:type IV pilus assembly protein PilW
MNARAAASRGHTLIEIAISMALAMLVVLASLSLYRGQRAAYERAADVSRMHDTAVTALQIVGQQLQMAGHAFADAGPALFGCSQGRTVGTDAAPSCEPLTNHSDGVLVRYAADTVSTWPSSTGAATDCLGQAVSGTYVANRFYARASASTGEPELYCEGGGRQAQPIVEGVERLHLLYWLAGAAGPVDASAITRDRWTDVTGADVCVLVRGDAGGSNSRAKYVDCDGATAVASDSRARQAFWRRIAVRNAAGIANAGDSGEGGNR